MSDGAIVHINTAEKAVPGPGGEHAVSFLKRGTLNVLLALGRFAPRPPLEPSAHEQDELYVVVRGSGVLVQEGRRDAFTCGDVMMVPAGTQHHFESFSEDLAVWVIFYGRKGGEAPE